MTVVVFREAQIDGIIVGRLDIERAAPAVVRDPAVTHDKLAVLKHEMGEAEHRRKVRTRRIDGDIGERAFAEMAPVLKAKERSGRGAGHDGDLT